MCHWISLFFRVFTAKCIFLTFFTPGLRELQSTSALHTPRDSNSIKFELKIKMLDLPAIIRRVYGRIDGCGSLLLSIHQKMSLMKFESMSSAGEKTSVTATMKIHSKCAMWYINQWMLKSTETAEVLLDKLIYI